MLLRNVNSLFAICERIVGSVNSVPFPCLSFTLKDNNVLRKVYEFHEMLFWESHMCYSEKISRSLRYVKVLLEVRKVFFFSVETLHWMIITFFWKGKNSKKCFCENDTCVNWKWEAVFWDIEKFVKSENSFPFLCRSLTFEDNHNLLKGKNFMKCLWEKRTFVTLKLKTIVWDMWKIC